MHTFYLANQIPLIPTFTSILTAVTLSQQGLCLFYFSRQQIHSPCHYFIVFEITVDSHALVRNNKALVYASLSFPQ